MAVQLSLDDVGPHAGDPPDRRGGGATTLCRLLTAQEVATVLRVPRSTIYELARNRRIPFLKVGRRTLFERGSLLERIAAHRIQPP